MWVAIDFHERIWVMVLKRLRTIAIRPSVIITSSRKRRRGTLKKFLKRRGTSTFRPPRLTSAAVNVVNIVIEIISVEKTII